VNHISRIARQGPEKRTVTIHNDKAELLIRLEQFAQSLSMELIVAEIERSIDGLERLKIDIDFALLSFAGDDFTTVYDQAIGRDFGVEFEFLLRGGDGGQDGETIHAGLDIGGGTLGTVRIAMGTGAVGC